MDTEKAKAIRTSSNWEYIQQELDLWILSELQKTKNCLPEDLIRIQTTIGAFEKVKCLPDIIIDREE